MLFSTVFDYFNGLMIERRQSAGASGKGFLILSVCGNLALLGFFKYAGFSVETAGSLIYLISGGSTAHLPAVDIALPIGISFYTFQTMSYSIDVYRKDVNAQHNFIDFAAYVTMFPQLIAGPIVRYRDVGEQIAANRSGRRTENFSNGAGRFIIGLGKKVLIANQVGMLWSEISAGTPDAATAWIGALCYSFQIYFDFSGYSDMAIGLGMMLGFSFPENFDYPYTSRNITEFWRRWHMTLGGWFRDYVYIPLGGNQRGMPIQLRNIIIVWALTGLWHGAAWNFVCWGLYYGAVLILEKLFLLDLLERLPSWAGHIYTMFIVIIGWMMFAAEDFGSMAVYFKCMAGAGGNGLFSEHVVFYIESFGMLLVIAAVGCTPIPKKIVADFIGKRESLSAVIVENLFLASVLLLCLAFLTGDSYNPFLYFRF